MVRLGPYCLTHTQYGYIIGDKTCAKNHDETRNCVITLAATRTDPSEPRKPHQKALAIKPCKLASTSLLPAASPLSQAASPSTSSVHRRYRSNNNTPLPAQQEVRVGQFGECTQAYGQAPKPAVRVITMPRQTGNCLWYVPIFSTGSILSLWTTTDPMPFATGPKPFVWRFFSLAVAALCGCFRDGT